MFEELQKLIGDSEEAKTVFAKVKNEFEQKTETIESLQHQFNNVKSEKDKYKTGNQLLKSKLGINKVDESLIDERIAELTKSGGDSAQKLQELTQALALKDDEISGIKNEYDSKMDTFRIESEVAKGIDAVSAELVGDPILRDTFKRYVAKGVGIVGDTIAPYTVVGDQKVPMIKDGKTMGVADYAKNLLESQDFASFRLGKTVSSPGPTGGGSLDPRTKTPTDYASMSVDDRAEYLTRQAKKG